MHTLCAHPTRRELVDTHAHTSACTHTQDGGRESMPVIRTNVGRNAEPPPSVGSMDWPTAMYALECMPPSSTKVRVSKYTDEDFRVCIQDTDGEPGRTRHHQRSRAHPGRRGWGLVCAVAPSTGTGLFQRH